MLDHPQTVVTFPEVIVPRLRSIAHNSRTSIFVVLSATAALMAGCADQEASYLGARSLDPDHQSGLGNSQQERPIVVTPPAADPGAQLAPQRYQWNGNPQRVIEGKGGATPSKQATKQPDLKPQPPMPSTTAAVGSPNDAQTYEVQAGDTLHGIAERHGVTVASLSQANALSGAPLKVGQKLVLPSAAR